MSTTSQDWTINNVTWRIADLVDHHAAGALNLRPEYQRAFVWNKKTCKKLIFDILQGQDVPKFYFHAVRQKNKAERYDVIDGQQRITAILQYIDGVFPLTIDGLLPDEEITRHSVYFSQLPDTLVEKLWNYNISAVVITTTNIDRIINQFMSLQTGVPLKSQERREAQPSELNRAVHELAESDMLNIIKFTNRPESGKRAWCSRLMVFELSHCTRLDFSTQVMDRFYLHSSLDKGKDKRDVDEAIRNVLDTLSDMNRIFKGIAPTMNASTTMGALYLTLRLMKARGIDVTKHAKAIRDAYAMTTAHTRTERIWTTGLGSADYNKERVRLLTDAVNACGNGLFVKELV